MGDRVKISSSAKQPDYSSWAEATRRSYDRMSGLYDLMSNRYEKTSRKMGLTLLQALPDERVLVIGCGTGHSLVRLAERGGGPGMTLGLELSHGMILQSRTHLRDEGRDRQASLIQGDAHDLPMRDGSMNGLFMAFTLELFPPGILERVLSECRRVLAPGGRLVVVALSKARGEGGWVGVYSRLHKIFPHIVDCEPIFVSKLLEEAGFTIEKQEFGKVWRLPVEIVLGRKP